MNDLCISIWRPFWQSNEDNPLEDAEFLHAILPHKLSQPVRSDLFCTIPLSLSSYFTPPVFDQLVHPLLSMIRQPDRQSETSDHHRDGRQQAPAPVWQAESRLRRVGHAVQSTAGGCQVKSQSALRLDSIFPPPRHREYDPGMANSRKKPSWAFWATVALVVAFVAYPLSWGAWFYAAGKWKFGSPGVSLAGHLFTPLEFAVEYFPTWVDEPYKKYCQWCWHRGQNGPANFTTSIESE